MLEIASSWNGWTPEELLMQFAGHLRGRALQEWNQLAPRTERPMRLLLKPDSIGSWRPSASSARLPSHNTTGGRTSQ